MTSAWGIEEGVTQKQAIARTDRLLVFHNDEVRGKKRAYVTRISEIPS